MIAKPEAVILVGGKSSRFGSDKCFALIDGQGFLERIIHELNIAGFAITLAGPREKLAGFHLPIMEDTSPFSGPLAAMQSCLQQTSQDRLLFCAVDMPLLHSTDYQELLVQSQDYHITCYQDGATLLPFPAIYPKTILPALLKQRDRGDEKMQTLLSSAKKIILNPIQRNRFINMNRPG